MIIDCHVLIIDFMIMINDLFYHWPTSIIYDLFLMIVDILSVATDLLLMIIDALFHFIDSWWLATFLAVNDID